MIEAAAFLSQQVTLRDPDIIEEQLGSVLGFITHFLQIAPSLKPVSVSLHQNKADPFAGGFRIGFTCQNNQICQLAVADKDFLAIDDKVIPVGERCCLYILQV